MASSTKQIVAPASSRMGLVEAGSVRQSDPRNPTCADVRQTDRPFHGLRRFRRVAWSAPKRNRLDRRKSAHAIIREEIGEWPRSVSSRIFRKWICHKVRHAEQENPRLVKMFSRLRTSSPVHPDSERGVPRSQALHQSHMTAEPCLVSAPSAVADDCCGIQCSRQLS